MPVFFIHVSIPQWIRLIKVLLKITLPKTVVSIPQWIRLITS